MTTVEKLCVLRRMHALIRRRGTGCPDDFARRVAVSRATLFRYLNELRNLGATIEYCTSRESYFYSEKFDFF